MKKLYFLLYFCFAILSSLEGKILETRHFEEITKYVTPDTLVILDIDDTLLIPVQTLGTDAWFTHRLKHYMDQDKDAALNHALGEWEAVRHITKVQIVEKGAENIIDQMQKNKVVLMGLTTQGLALATRTMIQLRSLQIDLSRTSPSHQDHYFMNGDRGVLFRQGILFTSGSSKGAALVKLFDIINYHPKHIVFINDKKTHLQDVEASVLAKNIEFIGLRYSYSDERVAHFRPDIAEIQWNHSTFDHLLSDEEALSLLNEALGTVL